MTAKEPEQKEVYAFYMANLRRGNNWDLVDCAAYKIAGRYLYGKDLGAFHKLSNSSNLREQRVSMISTMYFVQRFLDKHYKKCPAPCCDMP